jgi:hypothetical protein
MDYPFVSMDIHGYPEDINLFIFRETITNIFSREMNLRSHAMGEMGGNTLLYVLNNYQPWRVTLWNGGEPPDSERVLCHIEVRTLSC